MKKSIFNSALKGIPFDPKNKVDKVLLDVDDPAYYLYRAKELIAKAENHNAEIEKAYDSMNQFDKDIEHKYTIHCVNQAIKMLALYKVRR